MPLWWFEFDSFTFHWLIAAPLVWLPCVVLNQRRFACRSCACQGFRSHAEIAHALLCAYSYVFLVQISPREDYFATASSARKNFMSQCAREAMWLSFILGTSNLQVR